MLGRRVANHDEVVEPGDYTVNFDEDGRPTLLWAALPNRSHVRIPAYGHGYGGPEWSIAIEEDGTVTVDPSIRLYPLDKPLDPEDSVFGWTGDGWHGYLRRGVFEPC